MSYIAVITNCMLVAFTSRQLDQILNTNDIVGQSDVKVAFSHGHDARRPSLR
jgi:hypothetical protein